VIISAETEVRIIDASGQNIGGYSIDSNNGTISNIELDN
jgi:hypothetical protein